MDQVQLYARYLCSRDALGRPSAARDDRVSCIQQVQILVAPHRLQLSILTFHPILQYTGFYQLNNFFISSFAIPLIPYLSSFVSSILWSIVSNALLKSMNMPSLYARYLCSRDALGLKAEQRYAKRVLGGRFVRAQFKQYSASKHHKKHIYCASQFEFRLACQFQITNTY